VTEDKSLIAELERSIASVILGKQETVRLSLVTILAQGHLLVEDAPGVGKTSLAKSLAKSFDCEFKRLQFTPDMLPSDILGSSVYLPSLGEFEFRSGPIFTNVLLADEINRTTPRTQSALLEAMSEGQVSVEGKTHRLPDPFFVLATQNPFEFEGTYPLPENQLDRFMMCIEIGYPSRDVERNVLTNHRNGEPVDKLTPVVSTAQLRQLQESARQIRVDDAINDYMLDIIHATRSHEQLQLGVSTRGAITLYRAVQSMALVEGRSYVIPDDVKRLAGPFSLTVSSSKAYCTKAAAIVPRWSSTRLSRRLASRINGPNAIPLETYGDSTFRIDRLEMFRKRESDHVDVESIRCDLPALCRRNSDVCDSRSCSDRRTNRRGATESRRLHSLEAGDGWKLGIHRAHGRDHRVVYSGFAGKRRSCVRQRCR